MSTSKRKVLLHLSKNIQKTKKKLIHPSHLIYRTPEETPNSRDSSAFSNEKEASPFSSHTSNDIFRSPFPDDSQGMTKVSSLSTPKKLSSKQKMLLPRHFFESKRPKPNEKEVLKPNSCIMISEDEDQGEEMESGEKYYFGHKPEFLKLRITFDMDLIVNDRIIELKGVFLNMEFSGTLVLPFRLAGELDVQEKDLFPVLMKGNDIQLADLYRYDSKVVFANLELQSKEIGRAHV